jgi:endonuclease YncB( thermonuclease family)
MTPELDMPTAGMRPALERLLTRRATASVLALVLALACEPARADVSGPACVENGSVLSINGTRGAGKCNGGTLVKLYGVKAPALDAICPVPADANWRCGLASASALLRAVRDREIDCRGNSKDGEGRLIALCFIGEKTVNDFMVEMGWAAADRSVTSLFNGLEAEAKAARRGIWASDTPGLQPD